MLPHARRRFNGTHGRHRQRLLPQASCVFLLRTPAFCLGAKVQLARSQIAYLLLVNHLVKKDSGTQNLIKTAFSQHSKLQKM